MKYRRIPSGDMQNDMLAGAMVLGLISAKIDFEYENHDGEHRIWAHGEVPESCEPEKWTEI